MYGLPHDFEERLQSWEELVGHLAQIASSQQPIRLSVGRATGNAPYLEVRGKLRPDGVDGGEHRFVINSAGSREEGGYLALDEDHFRGGQLLTYDGDDYFSLIVEMEGVVLQLQDTNSL